MNQVITLSNKNYFQYGKLFLMTRQLVDANFYLYGYGLTEKQQRILKLHKVEYREISQDDFENKMQFLKFSLIRDHIDGSGGGISFIDFDTFFVQDWNDTVFGKDFGLGVTVRNDYVKQKIKRAYANGGVIFSKNLDTSKDLMQFAIDTMTNGGDDKLPEYNEVFKTLEEGRPAHKTWKRSNLRWWVDQVFLSSLVLRYFKENGYQRIREKTYFDFNNQSVGLFPCEKFNRLDPSPGFVRKAYNRKTAYIIHMKTKGRDTIKALEKEVLKGI